MPKTVVLGVSGGIAAYKAAYLASLLKKQGYDVHVIMTKNAQEFVTALTFETLSGNETITDTFERTSEYDVKHVSLAKKADMFIVAPATANVLGKAASGIADDMLTTTLMAAECPVIFAPAMNTAMYEDAAVQENITILKNRGYHVMDTGEGMLACKDIGSGRMKEPDEIALYAQSVMRSMYDMHGISVLISAGPTREAIDPVRYLSNNSSGKMGYAIAEAALARGASVTLVSGPVAIEPPAKADVINVVSAKEMAERVFAASETADIVIMAAAVADYEPEIRSGHKIKKNEQMRLSLIKTQDILKELGARKKQSQVLVGFAAETENIESNALEKLRKKNLDMIALNDVSRQGEGFSSDNNNIKLFFKDGKSADLGSDSKKALAKTIVNEAFELYKAARA